MNKILLDASFFKYLAWFNNFLATYNGITYYDQKFSYEKVHLDASLTGLVYALPLPHNFEGYDIVHLEMINLIVAARYGPIICPTKGFRSFVTI